MAGNLINKKSRKRIGKGWGEVDGNWQLHCWGRVRSAVGSAVVAVEKQRWWKWAEGTLTARNKRTCQQVRAKIRTALHSTVEGAGCGQGLHLSCAPRWQEQGESLCQQTCPLLFIWVSSKPLPIGPSSPPLLSKSPGPSILPHSVLSSKASFSTS